MKKRTLLLEMARETSYLVEFHWISRLSEFHIFRGTGFWVGDNWHENLGATWHHRRVPHGTIGSGHMA